MKRILFAWLVLCGVAGAETIQLPARYVHTTYTVSTLTGNTWGEHDTDKLLPCSLEITKFTKGTNTVLRFVSKVRKNGNDKSGESSAMVDYSGKTDLIKIIIGIKDLMKDANMNPSDSSRKIYDSGDLSILFVSYAKSKKSYAEFNVEDATFILSNTVNVDKLSKAIEKVK